MRIIVPSHPVYPDWPMAPKLIPSVHMNLIFVCHSDVKYSSYASQLSWFSRIVCLLAEPGNPTAVKFHDVAKSFWNIETKRGIACIRFLLRFGYHVHMCPRGQPCAHWCHGHMCPTWLKSHGFVRFAHLQLLIVSVCCQVSMMFGDEACF